MARASEDTTASLVVRQQQLNNQTVTAARGIKVFTGSSKQKFMQAGVINATNSLSKTNMTSNQTKSTKDMKLAESTHLNEKKGSVPLSNFVDGLILSNQNSGMIQDITASKDSLEQLNCKVDDDQIDQESGDDVEYSSQDNDFDDDQGSEDGAYV